MLTVSRAELGNKEIYQVNVISDVNSLKWNMVTEMHMFFHIRDVMPSSTPEEEEVNDEQPEEDKVDGEQ